MDDEIREHTRVETALGELADRIVLTSVGDVDAAWKIVMSKYIDLVILDVFGENLMPTGLELMRRLTAAKLSTRVLFVSQFDLHPVIERLLELNAGGAAHLLAGFVDKRHQFPRQLRARVEQELESFEAKSVLIEGLEDVAGLISNKRHRYKTTTGFGLRSSVKEISVEIEHLLRDLFGLQLETGDAPKIHVRLSPVARHGLSAAVAVNAFVRVELGTLNPDAPGHQIVLKFGPKDDSQAERDSFLAYVRYGVELAQRVELLGSASRDSIGGLAYSFAGAQYSIDLVSLDDAMVKDMSFGAVGLAAIVLRNLFETRNWYSTKCPDTDLSNYFADNQRTDLRKSHKELEARVMALDGLDDSQIRITRFEKRSLPHAAIEIRVPGRRPFYLPGSSILGSASLAAATPACLVHGDMHGGNVLVEPFSQELDLPSTTNVKNWPRTCLIDFRNAGPGPRCIDAVSLEASIRLADVSVAATADRSDLGLLRQRQPGLLALEMATRHSDDLALYRYFYLGVGDRPKAVWSELCLTVLEGMQSAFEGAVTMEEYMSVSIRYTIRMLGFKLDNYSRLRMASWLGAQYALVRELPVHAG